MADEKSWRMKNHGGSNTGHVWEMYSGVREEWEMGWPDADGTSSLRNGGLSEPIDARRPSNVFVDRA
ncbi:hypothetical protein HZH68_005403 [Vespula germanica]|uniref:Uncharacterized protein n=3 Tax=Vespula TaxID=7451 RepID=A0A834KJM9_VESGE|nr:hypothetical protein HZH66_004928 [Vespula vulgaris]KAF7406034.1 hypothetical protein HZH68_005403 [Vespula germanica]KAF7429511.1 hypothetical protein H0235_005909 [Vespula pensylvanica]